MDAVLGAIFHVISCFRASSAEILSRASAALRARPFQRPKRVWSVPLAEGANLALRRVTAVEVESAIVLLQLHQTNGARRSTPQRRTIRSRGRPTIRIENTDLFSVCVVLSQFLQDPQLFPTFTLCVECPAATGQDGSGFRRRSVQSGQREKRVKTQQHLTTDDKTDNTIRTLTPGMTLKYIHAPL